MANQPFTIYIVRHGATKMNAESAAVSVDRERGWSDVPLTEEGREEARNAAAALKSKGIQAIVSSDLIRAKETAQIIGAILGVKPEFSFKLRPWNLGYLTGKDMKDANPQIKEHAQNPNEKVEKGETFNAFRNRAFEGFEEAVTDHRGKQLLLVAHHRIERLIAAWEKAGQPVWHSIDLPTFLDKGDPPGGIISLRTTEAALKGGKLTHAQAGYHEGHGPGGSHCSICEYFIVAAPPDCEKVEQPVRPNDGCKLFEARKGKTKVKANGKKSSVH